MSDSRKYDDMIDLPHHVSATRPRMSNRDRAAQFSPFAALVGYDDAVRETARLTDEMTSLDEDKRVEIGEKIRIICESTKQAPTVTVRYFIPDAKKAGGEYVSVTGEVKKVDIYGSNIVMADGTRISMDTISDIDGDIFTGTE